MIYVQRFKNVGVSPISHFYTKLHHK